MNNQHPLYKRGIANLVTRLEEQRMSSILLLGVLLIVAVGSVDYLTGNEVGLSLFYVLPISLVGWFTDRRFGLLASLASASVWLIADTANGNPYSHPLIPVWNTLIRFAFFVIITLLLSRLKSALQRESELARLDYLTGAVNNRFFYELLQMELDRLERYRHPFTLAYIDLDNFKHINDRFGHLTGDHVLRAVADSVRKHSRKTDIFARMGGDEFVLLLPETNQKTARIILSKIREGLLLDMQRNNCPVTFSIGVLTCHDSSPSPQALIQRADELMYAVKQDNKDSIRYSHNSS